jgi:hypothetical protein
VKTGLLATFFCVWFLSVSLVRAHSSDYWNIPSPDHEQTFAYGMEQNRVWAERGSDRHLVVLLDFTNDPFVDRVNQRQYDNFTFAFPDVRLGKDGQTFYFHAPGGPSIPVAIKRRDFFGINEIKLVPNASLVIVKPHGYLTLSILVSPQSTEASD